MAARASWRGTIALGGGLMPVYVEAIKATAKYAGDEPIKELCSCHHLPIDRSHRDAETGQPRATLTIVKGVEKPDGSYAILTDAQLESIKAGLDKTEIEPLALLDAKAWASHTVSELWYLKPQRKQAGSKAAVEGLYAYLAEREMILVVRVMIASAQHIVAIQAVDGKLVANRLRYAQEINDPEGDVIAVAQAQVADKAVEMFDTLLEDLPRGFDIANVEDATKARKQAAIQAAISGTPVATTEVPATEPTPAVDLMAQLQAAIDAKGKAPTKRKPAKAAPQPKVTT